MKKTKKSRAKKPAVTMPTAQLDYVSQHDISRGYQHIQDIATTCRQVENQLRQQGQNPLADTLKFLNLAEPRLTDKIIEKAIRPFFYFGINHDKIPNQKPFQDAVREKLSNPDALVIFDKMIRTYFQVLDFRIDGRNGKKTIRVAMNRHGTPTQAIPTAVHSVFPWSPANKKAAIYVGQLVSWNDCKLFIAYDRINPKTFTAFKRSVSTYEDITYATFLHGIQSQLFTRLADPSDKHRLDKYLRKNTPVRFTILGQLADHILNDEDSPRLSHLVKHAACQINTPDINTLSAKIDDAYETIILGEHEFFTNIPKNIPLAALQNILLCDPNLAANLLHGLEQKPLQNLVLDPRFLASINLSPTNTIHQARTAELTQPLKDIIESAWKIYVIEQRLLKILTAIQQNSLLNTGAILHLIFELVDPRALNVNFMDFPLERRFENHFLMYVYNYLGKYPLKIPIDQITIHDLIHVSDHYEPIDFNGLPKATRTHFLNALIDHLSVWRETAVPTPATLPTPQTLTPQTLTPKTLTPQTQTALDALDEINNLFDT